MEEVRLVWIRSEFYCKPCRIVVLLQEICNLFIQMVPTHTHTHTHTQSVCVSSNPPLSSSVAAAEQEVPAWGGSDAWPGVRPWSSLR